MFNWPVPLGAFRVNWNLEMLVFEERGKPEYPEKNLSDQGREPTTRPAWEVNAQPLRHPTTSFIALLPKLKLN